VHGAFAQEENHDLEKIVIYGNRAVALGMYHAFKARPDFEVVAFTVDRAVMQGDRFCELPIVPFDTVKSAFPPETHRMFIAVGYVKNNKIRRDRYLSSKEMGYRLPTLISPAAAMYAQTPIGDNCVVGSFTAIAPTAKIGNNVWIGDGCMIGEDVLIGDHCYLSGGVAVAGYSRVGSCCYFGIRSVVRNKVSIGNDCVIGAGALMLEDADDGSVYMGERATRLPISSDKLPLG
jgi:sugar O-acyltransferase (sialic acid O-acetyltransferase NeuD family)